MEPCSQGSSHESSTPAVRTFDQELIFKFDGLHLKILGKLLLCKEPPSSNIDELLGMEYLFNQCNQPFDQNYIDKYIDDGVNSGVDVEDSGEFSCDEKQPDLVHEDEHMDEENSLNDDDNDVMDVHGIPGWGKVDILARALLNQDGISIKTSEANNIIKLYGELNDYDKKPLVYQPIKMNPQRTSRFSRKKKQSGYIGDVAMKRYFTSGGSPSLPPSRSRLVEAICVHLYNKHTGNTTIRKKHQFRWKSIN